MTQENLIEKYSRELAVEIFADERYINLVPQKINSYANKIKGNELDFYTNLIEYLEIEKNKNDFLSPEYGKKDHLCQIDGILLHKMEQAKRSEVMVIIGPENSDIRNIISNIFEINQTAGL